MSTNYYVYPPGWPVADPIHLGKRSAGWPFAFRAYKDPFRPACVTWEVVDFASWRRLLDLGEVRSEAGSLIPPAEMVAITRKANEDAKHHALFAPEFTDAQGNVFCPYEFC